MDHMVSWESEDKCFKNTVVVTPLSAAKMLGSMRKEKSPLGLEMWYYSNDMLWKNMFSVFFLICNYSFSSVTCDEYR